MQAVKLTAPVPSASRHGRWLGRLQRRTGVSPRVRALNRMGGATSLLRQLRSASMGRMRIARRVGFMHASIPTTITSSAISATLMGQFAVRIVVL